MIRYADAETFRRALARIRKKHAETVRRLARTP